MGVESCFVTALDGLRLAFFEMGSGAPLLLLAGGPGTDPSYMDPVLERLSEVRRVVVPDQRGTGISDRPPLTAEGYAMERYLDDIESVRAHLGIEKWDVIGHSWGGWLALAYGVAHPPRVERMVLVGSCGPGIDFLKPALDELKSRITPGDIARASMTKDADDPDHAASERSRASMPCFFFDRAVGERFRDSMTGNTTTAGVFSVVMEGLRSREYDLAPALGGLPAPTLVLHGDYDHIPTRFPKAIAAGLPNARYVEFERCGHFPWLEHEEAFYAEMLGFLG